MQFSIFEATRLGSREKNEDRMGHSRTREACMLALADGMGGHPEGEVAAQIALETMSALFQREAQPRVPDVPSFLGRGLMSAHHQIIRYASSRGMMDTPRTTLVAAVVQRGQLHWVHCGDSRMYVVRGGQLLKRTRDHSYLEAKAGTGMPVKDVNRNVLFTCLGSTVRPMFDVGGPIVLQDQDRVMLCSDGLWGTLDDDTITRGMSERPLAEGMPLLIEQALRKGGPRCDNVTVIALEWEAAKSRSKRVRPGFIETGSMDDSEFASTIQPVSGMPDSALDELDDEAIERSIAEINEAIQRTALKKT